MAGSTHTKTSAYSGANPSSVTRALSSPREAEVGRRVGKLRHRPRDVHTVTLCASVEQGKGSRICFRNAAAPGSRGPWVCSHLCQIPHPWGERHAPHDPFRVIQRRVLLMAIREQHRYGTLPGHHPTPRPAQPGPPCTTRAPRKPRTGCPGAEGQGWRSSVGQSCGSPVLDWPLWAATGD